MEDEMLNCYAIDTFMLAIVTQIALIHREIQDE